MKFNVSIHPSGIAYEASQTNSILQSALNSGYHLEHSCKNGSCGKCKARIISGHVESDKVKYCLSEQDINNGYILTCCSNPISDLALEAIFYPELEGICSTIQPCKVERVEYPTTDIAIIKLKLAPNSNFKYVAGQYINLIIKNSRRSYSIANIASSHSGIELHIRRVKGGIFSEVIFNELKENQLLRFEGPLGTFFVRDSQSQIIFLAGGTGFAPIKSMVEKLLEDGTGRKIYIYWGASTRQNFYSELPERWQQESDNVHYIPVYSGKNEEWSGRKGMVHEAVLEDFHTFRYCDVYACGAPGMIESARRDFVLNR